MANNSSISEIFLSETVLIIASNSISTFLCTVLNILLLLVLGSDREMHDVTRFLYKVLAYLNMLSCVTWLLTILLSFIPISINCIVSREVSPFISSVFLFSLMTTLSFIGINKYIMVSRPLRYLTHVTLRRVKTSVATTLTVCWIGTAFMMLPIPGISLSQGSAFPCRTNHGETTASAINFAVVVCVMVPIVGAILCTTASNGGLLWIMWKHTKRAVHPQTTTTNAVRKSETLWVDRKEGTSNIDFKSQGSIALDTRSEVLASAVHVGSHRARLQSPKKSTSRCADRSQRSRMKGIKTLVIMTLSFYLCWLPFLVEAFFVPIKNEIVEALSYCLPCLSTWIQPLVHFMTSERARKIAKEIFANVMQR